MPKPTFHALPDDKRARFVDVALSEFVEHGYDLASISRMVVELGIAKGSVYQYFDDKLDLFEYLLDEAGRRKREAVAPEIPVGDDPFARLREMYVRGLAFWRSEPRWAALGLRLLEPSREPRVASLRQEVLARSHAFVRALLSDASARGALRSDLDADTAAHLVTGLLSTGLLQAYLGRIGVPLGGLPEGPLDVSDAVLLEVVDSALAILEGGLMGGIPRVARTP